MSKSLYGILGAAVLAATACAHTRNLCDRIIVSFPQCDMYTNRVITAPVVRECSVDELIVQDGKVQVEYDQNKIGDVYTSVKLSGSGRCLRGNPIPNFIIRAELDPKIREQKRTESANAINECLVREVVHNGESIPTLPFEYTGMSMIKYTFPDEVKTAKQGTLKITPNLFKSYASKSNDDGSITLTGEFSFCYTKNDDNKEVCKESSNNAYIVLKRLAQTAASNRQ